MNVAREWAAFAGALFTLMGISLAAAARRNAEDALSWERQWRTAVGAPDAARDEAPKRVRLVLAYRFGGFIFAVIGLGLIISVVTGRTLFMPRDGAREALPGGIIFTVCGVVLAVNTWLRRGRRAPRFLEGELLAGAAPLPPGERVADACSRAIIALFLAFGLRLLIVGSR